jgi:hypothetical protein
VWIRIVGGVAIVAAATAAAILLNLALLGYAQPADDPVGKLSPRAVFVHAPAAPAEPRPVPPGDEGGAKDD